jgi:hypothetical protein
LAELFHRQAIQVADDRVNIGCDGLNALESCIRLCDDLRFIATKGLAHPSCQRMMAEGERSGLSIA